MKSGRNEEESRFLTDESGTPWGFFSRAPPSSTQSRLGIDKTFRTDYVLPHDSGIYAEIMDLTVLGKRPYEGVQSLGEKEKPIGHLFNPRCSSTSAIHRPHPLAGTGKAGQDTPCLLPRSLGLQSPASLYSA